jgi:hypothetical protein
MNNQDIKAFKELAEVYLEWSESCKNPVQATTLKMVGYQIYFLYMGIVINQKGLNKP